MKYLYVNGDSYADGLDDDNFRVRFKNRWSTVLAKKLELKEINEKLNQSIFFSTTILGRSLAL